MIKKAQIFYNILSLLSVFLGFIFIVFLGKKFGATKQTDIYFLSLIIINYAGFLAESIWAAAKPYYIERKVSSHKESDILFSTLLNGLMVMSTIMVLFYFFIRSMNVVSKDFLEFLDIFIFVLFFKNIMLYQKVILDLEHFFSSNYIVDIIVTVANLMAIFYMDSNDPIVMIAYATLFGVILSVTYQSYILYFIIKIKYRSSFFSKSMMDIYIGSFKLRVGSLLYNFKDLIIATIFTDMGGGFYTLYSYASKFVGVIMQVINAPVVNVFSTKISYLAAHNRLVEVKGETKKVIIILSILYVFSSVSLYFLLPHILGYLFSDKFDIKQLLMIQDIFIYLALIYLVLTSSAVYIYVLDILKKFNFLLISNVVFFILNLLVYAIYIMIKMDYHYFMISLLVINVLTYLLYRNKYNVCVSQ